MPEAICLVTAPVSTDFEDRDEALSHPVRAAARAPKLGVLALAGALEQTGRSAQIFELDDAYAEYLNTGCPGGLEAFPAWVAPRIAASGIDLFGFSSLCSSYPISIRIAESLKREAPGCTVLFGGPQASVVDISTLNAFPFVDFILRGEADLSLLAFLDQWEGAACFSAVPGLTWRSPFGAQRNPDAPVIDDLDALPLPAYHLSSGLAGADFAFLELGRGCPFACTFCSTNDFFRRKFRLKSPAKVLAEMRLIASRYGFRGFNLVHDMFTVDRRRVVAFSEAMIESGEGFKWSCSARTDCVDRELLELMARAGCDGMFFGVETGSKRMQRIIDKDLDPTQARIAVDTAESLGILTTVSLIVGFPEENEDDLRDSLDMFMHAMRQPQSTPQLNILAPLAGTPIYSQNKDDMILEEVSSQLAYPGRSQSESDRNLVRNFPDIFPNFYILPTPFLDRPSLLELAEFMPMCRKRLRWLTVALYDCCGDILIFFRAWRQHRLETRSELTGTTLRSYYAGDLAKADLVKFVRDRMTDFGTEAIEALISCEEKLASLIAAARGPKARRISGRIASHLIPVLPPGLHVVELDRDIQSVIDALKKRAPATGVRSQHYYRTDDSVPDETRLTEVKPLVGRALLLCDGLRSVGEFLAEAGLLFDCPQELRHYAASSLLKRLRKEGFIQLVGPAASRDR